MAAGLYIHIPFCQSICGYCNFNRGLYDDDLAGRYVEAVVEEIRRTPGRLSADTVFFGGGTPSILVPSAIASLIDACRQSFDLRPDAEITLETNPETISADRAAGWRDAGVNRVSFGAQSFDAAELRRLDRAHAPERVDEAVAVARRAGFDNISLDLMFWLPGQSRESWRRTLGRAIALDPDHLSLYLLELYPNAPLKEAMARGGSGAGEWLQAPDDEAADMYLEAFERLDAAGFHQYEISNAARPGRESRHNLKYWTGGSWFGFGCGAHSTVAGTRWHNVAATVDYIDRVSSGRSLDAGRREMTHDERVEEAVFTGLRLTSGVHRGRFVEAYGLDPWKRYADRLAPCAADGLLWYTDEAFGLTRPGMLVSNEIGALVIA